MSRRELTSSTWPLPWWVAVVPGLLFGAGVFLVVHTASSWPYVAPARLSGMVAQAVGLIAPLVCAASAWVAERFTNRHSPLAWPVLPRATGGQGLRVLGVITMSWVVLSMGLGCLAQVLVMRRATGGHFYAVELLIAALGMTFFIVSGFGFGVTIARWHAPLWGLLWGLLWVWVIPIYAQGLLPFPSKNVEYFLFPGLSASDHRSLDMGVVAAILGWWLLVPASGVLALWLWFRVAARSVHWRALLIGAVVPVVVAGCGVGLAHALPSPFVDSSPPPAKCTTRGTLEYCVTQEQAPQLNDLVSKTAPAIQRMGSAWPATIRRVVSFSLAGEGNPPAAGDIGVNVTSASGIATAEMDIGAGLAGLAACDPAHSSQESIGWALTFAQWMAKSPDARPDLDPRAASLWNASDDQVKAWYTRNSGDLLHCRYSGPGPG